jgi:hypothetical protein
LLPSIAIVALAPLVGQQFSFVDALVFGFCTFVGGSLFFAIAVFLSTLFSDVWRPLLLTCLAAIAIATFGMALPGERDVFSAMTGRSYYYGGALPWPELLMSAVAAAAFVYFAAANLARRDF